MCGVIFEFSGTQKVKDVLGQFIINHPNILGKDVLGRDYEGIVLNTKNGHVKITSPEQKQVIANKQAAQVAARTEQPRSENKTAVVAVGSAIGHVGHQQLFNYAVQKAKETGGDPYMFIGPAEGKDDPIPPETKVAMYKKKFPKYASIFNLPPTDAPTLNDVLAKLATQGYSDVTLVVGADQIGRAHV